MWSSPTRKVNTETRDGETNLGFWDKADEWVSWKVRLPKPGTFVVSASAATVHEGAQLALKADSGALTFAVPRTGDWARFKVTTLGEISLPSAGELAVLLGPKDPTAWQPINLRYLRLTPKTE
jgi:hypothetical protein